MLNVAHAASGEGDLPEDCEQVPADADVGLERGQSFPLGAATEPRVDAGLQGAQLGLLGRRGRLGRLGRGVRCRCGLSPKLLN